MPVTKRLYSALFTLIIIGAFGLRFWRVAEPPTYMFDEVYHASTAKLIAHNDPRAFEWWSPAPEPTTAVDWLHPPLAKYTQALGMRVFGETSFGWRISSVIFGTGVIALSMVLAYILFASYPLSLLAGLLTTMDGLLLTMSRIAMNDIHVTFFILLSLVCYLRYRPELCQTNIRKKQKTHKDTRAWLLWTAVACGLAVASKWSGMLLVGFILSVEAFFTLKTSIKNPTLTKTLRTTSSLLLRSLLLTATVAVIYLASYTQMFLQGKDSEHFVELFKQTWGYQTHLTATHPYQSKPLEWFLNTRPVWFTVAYEPTTRADIYALGNPLLFWSADIALLFFLGWNLFKKGTLLTPPIIVLLLAYASVWLPWVLSPRIMFFYHYTPAVPLLCIFLAWILHHLWNSSNTVPLTTNVIRASIVALVLAIMITAVIWYPHWTFVPMPLWVKDSIYFTLPSWS